MIKYFLFFIVAYFGSDSNVFAQSKISTRQGEAAIVSDSLSKLDIISHGTISRAGRNQQSIYTPLTAEEKKYLRQESGSTLAIPAAEIPAIIDPKKK